MKIVIFLELKITITMTSEYFVTKPFVLDVIDYVKQDTFTIKVKDLVLHPKRYFEDNKLIFSPIKKLSERDQISIEKIIRVYYETRKDFINNIKQIPYMLSKGFLNVNNLEEEYIRLIGYPWFNIYIILMDIYTVVRMLKKYVKIGIFFGGELHSGNYKRILMDSGFKIVY